jgi:hypothetical protein
MLGKPLESAWIIIQHQSGDGPEMGRENAKDTVVQSVRTSIPDLPEFDCTTETHEQAHILQLGQFPESSLL